MSKQEKLVLVFDVGTQSSRAMLVNTSGEILGKCQVKHEPAYLSEQPDWAEQEADFYYECICRAARGLKEQKAELWPRIAAVSVTTIRDTVVCVDKEGKPLRPVILWLDKRRAKGKPEFSQVTKVLLKTVGMEKTANIQFQKSHCNWIRDREPEIWEKTDKYLLLSGYLIYKITGRMVDTVASMVGHIPFDNQSRKWQHKGALTRPVFPVEQEKLCEVVESGETMGSISAQMAADSGVPEGLPVIATGSDKACEILGLGCIDKEQAAVGLGTTATITFMLKRYLEPERFIPPYASIIQGCFTPEIEIFRGYWLISWFKKEFAAKEVVEAAKTGVSAEAILNERLKEVPPGCQGLLFQPYFTPNITMPTARGAMIGFSDVHTRIHLYRAIIEGINFALIDGMKLLEQRAGHKFTELHVGGGGSQSDEICQITANMFGIPVVRMQSHEATGLGCAMAVFVALGVFSGYHEAVKTMVHEQKRFEPDMKVHKVYQELYEDVFQNIYGKLSPLYKRLHEIYHRE